MTEKRINKKLIQKAFEIAKRDLRSCYINNGIVAGLHHFDDFWARDAFYASFGALTLKDYDKAKNVLDLFLSYQLKNGLIPRRIDRYYFTFLKYPFNIKIKRKNFKIVYKGRYGFPNIDPNTLLLILAEEYISKSKDKQWLGKNFDKLLNVLYWLKSQDEDHDELIEENGLANWMDTIIKFKRHGKTIYTNILVWKAIKSSFNLFLKINKKFPKDLENWKENIKKKINEKFWNGEYFSDYIHNNKRYDYFCADGNILSVVFDFADAKQKRSILNYENQIFNDLPTTNYPSYPESMLVIQNVIFGMRKYQNNYAIWLWIVALDSLVHYENGRKGKAIKEIEKISYWIVKNNKVYEVYHPNGNPYHKAMWKSEAPFAWSSGIFIYVLKEMKLVKIKS